MHNLNTNYNNNNNNNNNNNKAVVQSTRETKRV